MVHAGLLLGHGKLLEWDFEIGLVFQGGRNTVDALVAKLSQELLSLVQFLNVAELGNDLVFLLPRQRRLLFLLKVAYFLLNERILVWQALSNLIKVVLCVEDTTTLVVAFAGFRLVRITG